MFILQNQCSKYQKYCTRTAFFAKLVQKFDVKLMGICCKNFVDFQQIFDVKNATKTPQIYP